MRLLTRRIHRAFPELDRYDDEQCARFIRAARRGVRRRLWVTFLVVFAGVFAFALSGVAWMQVSRPEDWAQPTPWAKYILLLLLTLPVAAAGPVTAYLTRDWLLRRRIRYILRARGQCMNCHYGLIGLPVGAESEITCPECQTICYVDPSLGELVLDESGKPRYQPNEKMLGKSRLLTPARSAWLKRWSLRAALLFMITAPVGWGGYELWLRLQAAAASAARPLAAGLLAHVESVQPKGVRPQDGDAWLRFSDVRMAIYEADTAYFTANGLATSGNDRLVPEFTLVGEQPNVDSPRASQERKQEALARRLIDYYREHGVYEKMDQMAASPWTVRPIDIPASKPAMELLLPELGQVRQLARINAARMVIALERSDKMEFCRALDTMMASARMLRPQPTLIDANVARSIETLAFSRMRRALATHITSEWLDGIDEVLARQTSNIGLEHAVEGERLLAMDNLGWIFADPDRVRFGAFSPALRRDLGVGSQEGLSFKRLGTFSENKDAVNREFDATIVALKLPRAQRVALGAVRRPALLLLDDLLPALDRYANLNDQILLERAGVETMLALERYRLRHGRFPEALAELTPGLLPSAPIDPWSGKVLGYKCIDPSKDPYGRGYLLWSVGADGQDNDGREPELKNRFDILMGKVKHTTGVDFVLNVHDW
ncbi:MAG: hypothetical protein JSR77_09475 [Planctomycetes bacterium]|nr:hypothetical protein [Planctomycetota bacterium]